jgi:hypothetical protein
MRISMIALLATAPVAWAGCASFPAPTQRMADAESAQRSAREVGADTQPVAKLEAKLAEEQIARAKILVANGDNRRADFVLRRARADAELALALAREQNAGAEVQNATQQSGAAAIANTPGARP